MSFAASVRVLLGSWLLEGVGWFALTETLLRLFLEGTFVLVLWGLRTPLVLILAGWVGFHTAAWFLLYGGYAKVRSMRQVSTPLDRLLRYRDRVASRIRRSPRIRAAVLYGSGARGTMGTRSDVDLLVVPERPRLLGVLSVWALRMDSAMRRMPLEAYAIDMERYVPFRLRNVSSLFVKQPASSNGWAEQLRTRGVLVSISGIDGSGKTTVARELIPLLRGQGRDALYFYGHRPFFRRGETPSPALIFKALWRRLGRTSDDFSREPKAKLLLDLLTLVDYIRIQGALARLMRPGRIVIADRYVADVIVYLRSFGKGHQSVEGLIAGISFEPDLAFLFEIDPQRAHERKGEETIDLLERVTKEYEDLAPILHLRSVDATGSVQDITREVLRQVEMNFHPEV
ncbi:MAG TPA: nucleotidyltransferase domain-containing protein [Thermoplasmata archaeon]|nr:nucleotidyltransferase domain-containing protein [Thermoplasmata archaeon]